jgi:hypothetical protein
MFIIISVNTLLLDNVQTMSGLCLDRLWMPLEALGDIQGNASLLRLPHYSWRPPGHTFPACLQEFSTAVWRWKFVIKKDVSHYKDKNIAPAFSMSLKISVVFRLEAPQFCIYYKPPKWSLVSHTTLSRTEICAIVPLKCTKISSKMLTI